MPKSYTEFVTSFQLQQNELTMEMYNDLLTGKFILYYSGSSFSAPYYCKYDSKEALQQIGMQIIFGDEDMSDTFEIFEPFHIF